MQNSRERNRKTEDHLGRRVDRLDRCLRQTRKHGAGRLPIDLPAGPARRRRGRCYHGMISGALYTAATGATSRPSEGAKSFAEPASRMTWAAVNA